MLPHALKDLSFVERFYSLKEIDSTNSYAKTIQNSPSQGIFVIQADKQNAGRGRRDNLFFSDHSGGLWVSIVIPLQELSDHFIYNRAISLALCETLQNADPGATIKIKWPNDIYWGNRKIAGILLETAPTDLKAVLVVGFGLNVNIPMESFPHSLRQTATSVQAQTGERHHRTALLNNILIKFHSFCSINQVEIHRRYTGLLYRVGSKAVVDGVEGVFESVDLNGQICIQTEGGQKFLSSGTLRFPEGREGIQND